MSGLGISNLIFTNLKLFQVAVSVITKAGVSELSDYLVNETSPAKPEGPPENIKVTARGSNWFKLHWQLPSKPNGPISLYELRYGYRDHKGHYAETTIYPHEREYTLTDLAFNVAYEVKIRACGILPDSIDPVCGDWGAIIHETGVGPSGPMPAPDVTFVNSTEVKVRK